MRKRIALLWPYKREKRFPYLPLWALSLGAYLKKKIPDVEIRILDGQIMTSDMILEEMAEFIPEIVGISLSHEYYKNALIFARRAKSLGAKVVFGGVFAGVLGKEILWNRGPRSNDYCVDVIVKGDGERAFFEYIAGKPLNRINNLIYQKGAGVKENSLKFLDLSRLPAPDRTIIDMRDYFRRQREIKGLQGSRMTELNVYFQKGCHWRQKTGGCIFCCRLDSRLRLKSPAIFLEEIRDVVLKYKPGVIKVDGEDFLGNIKWLIDFSAIYRDFLRRNNRLSVPPRWTILARADSINIQTVKIFKKMNVKRVFIGFESGNDKCLAAARKGVSRLTLKKAAYLLNKCQIEIIGSFILGLPGETAKTLSETLELINKISRLDYARVIQFQFFTPLPGSAAWQMFLKKTGNKYKDKDLIDWNEARKDWIKYFCNLSARDIIEAKKELERLARQQSRVRFSLIDEIKF